ncbi:hypothetical protein WA026_019867 [Henosepilachna vigintioctopunctata]|uniref:Uncharacterized protein n=1 Tax=Henosepilachna vigintioctopunctata TaxID=420089 RepID=A0AAW1VH25_9CUCU
MVENLKSHSSKSDEYESTYKNNWIKNFTDIEVPEYANKVLSLGPKFAATIDYCKMSTPLLDIIANVEIAIEKNTIAVKDEIRASCSNIMTNFKKKHIR